MADKIKKYKLNIYISMCEPTNSSNIAQEEEFV